MANKRFRHFEYYTILYLDYDQNAAEIIHPKLLQNFDHVKAAMDWEFKHEQEPAVDLVETL